MARSLGSILVDQGVVDASALERAEARRRENGGSLGKALLELGLASEEDLMRALAAEVGLDFVDIGAGDVDHHAAEMIGRGLAEEVEAIPVAFGDGDELVVAVSNPGNTAAKQRIEEATGLPVRLALAARTALRGAITHLPQLEDEPSGVAPAESAASSSNGGPAIATGASKARVPDKPDQRLTESEEATSIDLAELLQTLVDFGGSDLHLTAGIPPAVRVHGELEHLESYDPFTPAELRKMIYGILTEKQREIFENELELDTSYAVPGLARFRVNVFQQRDSLGAVMRVIPFEIKTLDELGIPPVVGRFAQLPRGLVLVTGPTGSGKSTTLAALIDLVNTTRRSHIMTVEDPIEFLHEHKSSVVNQREVGQDTHGFTAALKHVLRQDPDVILVGEMRDLETIQIALTAAETGHLVFGTLHTQDAPQTIDRVIDVFPPHQQEQIRVMLAGALQGVVAQQLLKTADGAGRVAACEVMIATAAVNNLIREGKTHQLYSTIQSGGQLGMISMDQSLARLVQQGTISFEAGLAKAQDENEFNRLTGRG